jgi:hypothetical protein
MLDAPPGSMTIKKKIPTKYKLPNLNWTSLKPGQVRGTVFSELDDEKYFKVKHISHPPQNKEIFFSVN